MASEQIREALHKYIDTASEEKLEAIYIFLRDNIKPSYKYDTDELFYIYTRRDKYKTGEAEVLTTGEFINFVHCSEN